MAVLSKQQQVEMYFRKGIQQGRWAAGRKLPSDLEVCNELNVSQGTVAKAMAVLKSEGLLSRRQNAGTFISKNIPVKSVVVLGKVDALASPQGYYYRAVFEEARRQIESAGYTTKLGVGQGDTSEEFASSLELFDKPSWQNHVGVISTLDMGPLQLILAERSVPSVSIVAWRAVDAPCIVLDYKKLCIDGIRLLKKRGLHDYAVLFNTITGVGKGATQERTELLQWIGTADNHFNPSRLIEIPYTRGLSGAPEVIQKLWNTGNRPQALFFLDDISCDLACMKLAEIGVRIPQDIGILTHSVSAHSFQSTVPLTRFEFDPAKVVTAAWQLLQKLMESPKTNGPYTSKQHIKYIAAKFINGNSL